MKTIITATLRQSPSLLAIALTTAGVSTGPAMAQDAARPSPTTSQAHRPAHASLPPEELEAGGVIVVTGHLPIDYALLAGTRSIEGDDLVAAVRGQLGDTLARLPGVSATSFAPGASRPVLRGFDGPRIAVLTDGIGAIDASSVSADHAVVFDALTVDHIDVLHGPAVLLFGGQAIGGAVNALDKRIPRQIPDAPSVTAIGGFGSAADERSAAAALEFPLADRWAGHLDASWRKSDDVRTGGFVNSRALREDLLADAAGHVAEGEDEEADELTELAGLKGRIPNSRARSLTLGAGLAFIDAGGDLGISVQRYDTRYGVPLRPGFGHAHGAEEEDHGEDVGDHGEDHGEEHGSEKVSIDLVQTRIDLRGGVKIGGAFDSLQFRGAYGDYKHVELEGEEVGTRFASKGIEFRADLIQSDRGDWRGRSGVHYIGRSMRVTGAEAFTPNYQVSQLGFFTLQSVGIGSAVEAEGALRYDRSTVEANSIGFDRSFGQWSAAAGLSWAPAQGWKIGANYIRSARAPSPEELLSDGPHIATQAYELGDPALRSERSDGIELYARYESRRAGFSLTGFLNDFDRFIAAVPTGEERDGLPVNAYRQLPARFKGFEASAHVEPFAWSDGALTLDAAADYTHARLKGSGPVPRIPPLRIRGGAEVKHGELRLRGEVEWNRRQGRVALGEEAVPGFTLVNLLADWHPMGEDGLLSVMLSADNLLDAVGRRAASFTRDFVPIAGRDIRLTVKIAI
jgi:iron complex outermembrane receptor protein